MGCSQSDLVIIKALRDGISYLRKYPAHLDFIFEDSTYDLVNSEFGKKEVDAAKKWFLNTNIPVLSVYRIDKPIFPCVTIEVKSSNEDKSKAGLGEADADIYEEEVNPEQYISAPRINLGPFTPTYNLTTGIVTLPDGFDNSLIFPGQGLTSAVSGTTYPITTVGGSTFTIATDIRDNFTNSYISPAYNTLHVTRRHAHFAEQYQINCYVSGATGELYWLHSIIQYILLQRRQYLFEKYNIGLGTISSGPIQKEMDDSTENFFLRSINMEANVEVTWVDAFEEFIEGIAVDVNVV